MSNESAALDLATAYSAVSEMYRARPGYSRGVPRATAEIAHL